MVLLQRPNGVIEVRSAQFRCRLSPLGAGEGYRVFLFHHKANGFVDSRLIFQIDHPAQLAVLLEVLQTAIQGMQQVTARKSC